MANLVMSNLIVTGKGSVWFIKNLNKYGLGYFVPMPEFLEAISIAQCQDWAYDNWGTKWELYKSDKKEEYVSPEEAILSFTTANGSIVPFVDRMRVAFPTLTFELNWKTEDDNFSTVHYH